MTDPIAQSNFAKYGNPEGPGRFHVSVALPKSISEKENHFVVLSVFFVIVTVVIPSYFYNQLQESDQDPLGPVSQLNRMRLRCLYDPSLRAE